MKGTLDVEVGGAVLEGVPLDAEDVVAAGDRSGDGDLAVRDAGVHGILPLHRVGLCGAGGVVPGIAYDDVRVVPVAEVEEKSVIELEPGSLRMEEGNVVTVTLRRSGAVGVAELCHAGAGTGDGGGVRGRSRPRVRGCFGKGPDRCDVPMGGDGPHRAVAGPR